MSLDLSILIISYNTRDLTLACLRSVYEQTHGLRFEVIVVDNASTDASPQALAEQFPQARLVQLKRNIGFAAANNLAAEHANGQSILLLNPDTVVLDGAIQKLHAFALANSHRASIFGGKTLFPDGSLNRGSCWRRPTLWSVFCNSSGLTSLFPESDLFSPESYGSWRRDSVRPVDIVSGCFLLIGKDLWTTLGGFDTDFFMYGEEADLCWRAMEAGHRCLICPDATIIHYGGASEKVRADKMIRLFVAKARLFAKHWNQESAELGALLLDGWVIIRLLAFSPFRWFVSRFAASHQTWQAVWRQRQRWHMAAGA